MDFGERLKEIRLRRGLTLQHVADKLGKTEATIQRYESGNIKNLKSDIIEQLANILNVKPAELMGWEKDENKITMSEYDYLPVTIAAGSPDGIDAIKKHQISRMSIPDTIMGKWAGSPDIFLMRICGDSMNQVFPNNSLIAVKKTAARNLNDGDIVVFSNENDYAVKRFYNDTDNKRMIFRPDSTDKRYLDYSVPYSEMNALKIYGKVVMYVVVKD